MLMMYLTETMGTCLLDSRYWLPTIDLYATSVRVYYSECVC